MTTRASEAEETSAKPETEASTNGASARPSAAEEAASLEEQAVIYRMTEDELKRWAEARQHAERIGQHHSRVARDLMAAEQSLQQAQEAYDRAKAANAKAAEKAAEADQAWEAVTQEVLADRQKPGTRLAIKDDGSVIDQVELFKLRQAATQSPRN